MEYVNFFMSNYPNLKVHNPTDIIRGHAEALIDETSRWRGAEARKNSVIVGAATQSSPRRTAAAPRGSLPSRAPGHRTCRAIKLCSDFGAGT